MRRVLEDKAFVALTRGVWDHVGSRAYDCLQNLASGGENPVRSRPPVMLQTTAG